MAHVAGLRWRPLWLLAGTWLCVLAHQSLLRCDGKRAPASNRPSDAASLRRWALTYRPQVADGLYLRAVNAFGSGAEHRAHYPSLAPLLWRSSDVDPSFAAPYLLAGTALTSAEADNDAALALLRRGAAMRPDVWRIHFLYGFELFSRGQFRVAAQAMANAAALPQAPPYVRGLAVRLAAEGGDPALGLAMLDGWQQSMPTPDPADVERRAALVYQQMLARWQACAQRFVYAHGRAARDMAELARFAQAGEAAPQHDPWGAPFVLDAEGAVTSRHFSKRLRIHREPAGATP